MSGPITATFGIDIATLLLVSVVNEAVAMGTEYQAALDEARMREKQRQEQRETQLAATRQRMTALHAQVEKLEARIRRLAALGQGDVKVPERPSGEADANSDWSAYLRELEALEVVLNAQVESRAGQALREALAAADKAPGLESVMELYLAQRQQMMNLTETDVNQWRATVERILARLEHAPGEALPVNLENLAREIILAETPARAELLANELRFRIHRIRQEQAEAEQAVEEARQWLLHWSTQWQESAPESLKTLVEEAAAGLIRLDGAMRQRVMDALAAAQAEQDLAVQQASAQVLEQSLQDLGYQVEGVEQTLFLEGGMVHFQRSDWEGYFVRLRVNPAENTFNFNVVRAREEGKAEDDAHRKRMDFMAEERWCTEYPKLMETLAARGLHLQVTRLLGAGELPVQAVAPESLPDFAAEESRFRSARPQARKLPGNS